MKRSSWASGSGYVPSCSMGFWVASTKKGCGSWCVFPAAVICFSAMASSRADWVFGGVRLISSASIMFAKTGPFANRNDFCPVAWFCSRMSEPVMSAGMRSGVNCMRLKERPSIFARVAMSFVLASPGTPSMMQCPEQSIAMKICCIVWSRPTIWYARFWRSNSCDCESWFASCRSFSGICPGSVVVTIMLLCGKLLKTVLRLNKCTLSCGNSTNRPG